MAISVCIVDDHPDIRSALEQIICLDEDYLITGSYADAEEALQKIPRVKPDIVLVDINLGAGENGIDCVRKLKSAFPAMLFMMCTVYEEEEKIFDALAAGASGYVLKKTTPAKLLDAVRELHAGGAPMSSRIASKVVAAFRSGSQRETGSQGKPLQQLSNRENEILVLLAKGLLYKEIAGQLFISQETVRKHVYHIYEKLHVNNRVEAVNLFFRRG